MATSPKRVWRKIDLAAVASDDVIRESLKWLSLGENGGLLSLLCLADFWVILGYAVSSPAAFNHMIMPLLLAQMALLIASPFLIKRRHADSAEIWPEPGIARFLLPVAAVP